MANPIKHKTIEERKAARKKSKDKWATKNRTKFLKQKREHYALNRETILAQQRENHRLIKLGLKEKGPARKKRGPLPATQKAIRRKKNTLSKQKTRAEEKQAKRQQFIDDFNKEFGTGADTW